MARFSDIATLLGLPAPAPDTRTIARVSNIEAATPDCIVFCTDSATLTRALASNTGAILAPAKLAIPSADLDDRILAVTDPRYAFALAGRLLAREAASAHPEARPQIDIAAIVSEQAMLGEGTTVGPFAVIEAGATLGEDCRIGPRVTIHAGARLGDRVVVQAGSVLGSTGFGYARSPETGEYLLFPQQGTLVIEDDVEIGALTTIDRGALGETRIGRGTKIDNLVHIAHNCVIGANVIIAAQTGISGSSIVEDGAILGGQVGIGEHATVGPGVILGGGAGVLSNKKMQGPGQVFWGRPARPLKEYLRDLARLRRG